MPEMCRAIGLWEAHIGRLVRHEEPAFRFVAKSAPKLIPDFRKTT
jgi:hypothetical protein